MPAEEPLAPRLPEQEPPVGGGERLHWFWRQKMEETGNWKVPTWAYLSNHEREAWEFVNLMKGE